MTQDRGTHDMRDGTRASVKQKGGEESLEVVVYGLVQGRQCSQPGGGGSMRDL